MYTFVYFIEISRMGWRVCPETKVVFLTNTILFRTRCDDDKRLVHRDEIIDKKKYMTVDFRYSTG